MTTIQPENIRTGSIKNLYQPFGLSVDVLRLDLLHPIISGNKWFKLKYYLEKAKQQKKKGIITFGGAYSNHIIATAESCRLAGLSSAGVIRGEKPQILSPMLQYAGQAGMKLYYNSRENYRQRQLPEEIENAGEWLIVDEGGYGYEGMRGAATIMELTAGKYDHVITAAGTGTTLAGICDSAAGVHCIGVSVLKNNASLQGSVNALLSAEKQNTFEIIHDFHFGGYAKKSDELLQFMNEWYRQTRIPSDFVYTGKMFFAVDTLIKSGYFSRGTRILTIHTGGLPGNVSLPKGTLIFDHFPL